MNWTWGTSFLILLMTVASWASWEFPFQTWIRSSRSRTDTEIPVISSPEAQCSSNCSPIQANTNSFHTVALNFLLKFQNFLFLITVWNLGHFSFQYPPLTFSLSSQMGRLVPRIKWYEYLQATREGVGMLLYTHQKLWTYSKNKMRLKKTKLPQQLRQCINFANWLHIERRLHQESILILHFL